MCGICGVVAFGRPAEVDTVERMAAELDHRGPDGDGSYAGDGVALGFRRLAIIDLSDAGMQPSATPSRSEEHTSELQSPVHLVCRLLLEKKNTNKKESNTT